MSENTERLRIIGWSINVEWSNGKKEKKYRQTLCENFISDWADVIEEIGIRNKKELE